MAKGRATARMRWLAVALLLVLAGAGVAWWKGRTWTPSRHDFPVQGVWLSEGEGAVEWPLLKGEGADFVYFTASGSSELRDNKFGAALAEAEKHGLKVGAVHMFDLCAPAERQAANFVTIVPRDPELLPPAVRLDLDLATCKTLPDDAALQSELTTFLNQIERHSEKPALLMVTPAFEKRYHAAALIERNIWVEGSFLMPGYAGRPWVLWTANRALRTAAVDAPVQWVVVRP